MKVSMCDPSIPLTTGEWEEWGNPNEEKYYEYMLSYGGVVHVEPLFLYHLVSALQIKR